MNANYGVVFVYKPIITFKHMADFISTFHHKSLGPLSVMALAIVIQNSSFSTNEPKRWFCVWLNPVTDGNKKTPAPKRWGRANSLVILPTIRSRYQLKPMPALRVTSLPGFRARPAETPICLLTWALKPIATEFSPS